MTAPAVPGGVDPSARFSGVPARAQTGTGMPDESMLLGCESCGLVTLDIPRDRLAPDAQLRCPRCRHVLRREKPLSVQRTWACVVAAAVLYVPANALPVMSTTSAFDTSTHTLLGGIHELWVDGSWVLAMIVFIASIAVPVLKIAALGLLAWSVRKAPRWRRLERARLFRLIEVVGHWSMLDVYVVVLLAACVRFGSLANAHPEPGLLAFAAVVVLTLLAAHSFDPRLIWREGTR
ncbi:MAG: paraquat-inducible protein A [Caldimonas sp.]